MRFDEKSIDFSYQESSQNFGFDIVSMKTYIGDEPVTLRPWMSNEEIKALFPQKDLKLVEEVEKFLRDHERIYGIFQWSIIQDHGFLEIGSTMGHDASEMSSYAFLPNPEGIKKFIRELIHLPGLRGQFGRTFPASASFSKAAFSGLFEAYTASVISHWERKEPSKIHALLKNLSDLDLASAIRTKRIDDTQIELQVSHTADPSIFFNIADVGLGVSQLLPVLVALHAASPGQLVIIEQPEIHLHPSAEVILAEIFARAVKRGVRLVVETHSHFLLRGIQTLVAKGELSPKDVRFAWFERKDGITSVREEIFSHKRFF